MPLAVSDARLDLAAHYEVDLEWVKRGLGFADAPRGRVVGPAVLPKGAWSGVADRTAAT